MRRYRQCRVCQRRWESSRENINPAVANMTLKGVR